MSPRGKSRVWPSAAVVFVVALAVRLAHVLALRESPYFARPVLDAETYYWAARALAAGEGWAERVYWQPPGYPYFLAAVMTSLPSPHPRTVPVNTWTPVPTNPLPVGLPAPPEIDVPSTRL